MVATSPIFIRRALPPSTDKKAFRLAFRVSCTVVPRETVSMSYDLEYGSNVLCIHKDSIKPGQRVLIIDDLLATGGTTETTAKLIESLGGIVAGFAFLFTIERITDMMRTLVNVTSDAVVAAAIADNENEINYDLLNNPEEYNEVIN